MENWSWEIIVPAVIGLIILGVIALVMLDKRGKRRDATTAAEAKAALEAKYRARFIELLDKALKGNTEAITVIAGKDSGGGNLPADKENEKPYTHCYALADTTGRKDDFYEVLRLAKVEPNYRDFVSDFESLADLIKQGLITPDADPAVTLESADQLGDIWRQLQPENKRRLAAEFDYDYDATKQQLLAFFQQYYDDLVTKASTSKDAFTKLRQLHAKYNNGYASGVFNRLTYYPESWDEWVATHLPAPTYFDFKRLPAYKDRHPEFWLNEAATAIENGDWRRGLGLIATLYHGGADAQRLGLSEATFALGQMVAAHRPVNPTVNMNKPPAGN